VQGLLVEILLVERPPELVESELVVRGLGPAGDRRIGVLGVAIFSAREEVLAAPELHFVEVLGIRIRADQALHGFHGLFGAAEFVVRPRHLIEDLVAVLVTGVLGEQADHRGDRLEVDLWDRDRGRRCRGCCAGSLLRCRALSKS
jgi:hypothetical protein